MIVCHCRVVSDRAVSAAVAGGASSVGEVAERCGAGADCGGCHRRLERLLAVAPTVAAASPFAAVGAA